jgi:hypothetical protein
VIVNNQRRTIALSDQLVVFVGVAFVFTERKDRRVIVAIDRDLRPAEHCHWVAIGLGLKPEVVAFAVNPIGVASHLSPPKKKTDRDPSDDRDRD